MNDSTRKAGKKLIIRKATVRSLTQTELDGVKGGLYIPMRPSEGGACAVLY